MGDSKPREGRLPPLSRNTYLTRARVQKEICVGGKRAQRDGRPCLTSIWQEEPEYRGDPGSWSLHGRSDTHRQSVIQNFDPCVLVLQYQNSSVGGLWLFFFLLRNCGGTILVRLAHSIIMIRTKPQQLKTTNKGSNRDRLLPRRFSRLVC